MKPSARKAKILTSDQIPENPFDMPPPYWRSGSAIFHVLDALYELPDILDDLITVKEQTDLQLEEYFRVCPNEGDDPDAEKFGDICGELWAVEHKATLKAEAAILMSAIEGEDDINRFCVFNLPRNVAESIESLSPAEKLLVAAGALGKTDTKSNAAYEAVRKLTTWRNAFAHGHCVDRPTKSLRHNHLIPPPQYPGVADAIIKMKELVRCYISWTLSILG